MPRTWNKKLENVTWLNYDYSEEDLEEILKKYNKSTEISVLSSD